MSSLRNRVHLIGHLGNDPEIVEIDKEKQLAKFSLATNEYYKTKNGEKNTETQWHQIVAWRNLAKICQNYLKKGNQIALEGKLNTRSYEDKNGEKRYVTEIVADDIVMLDSKES